MKAIIVEDEFHPREMLIQKLNKYHPDIQVVAACENAETALIEILRLKADILFLDIQLPEKNGLWLAEQLLALTCETFSPPAVVFTTAYTDSKYLLDAFRLAAVDYLVKPIAIDALSKAIERCKNHTTVATTLPTLINTLQKENIMRFKNFNGLLLLKPEDIAYVEADGNYSIIYLANGESEDIFERLGEIETRMSQEHFIRVSRSVIINRKFIRKIDSKKSVVQIAAGTKIYQVELPEKGIKGLLNNYL